jgi:oligoribonuclease
MQQARDRRIYGAIYRGETMTDPKHTYLWLDLETTGLDPHTCTILEWAVVLAADDADGDMQPVEQYSSVIGTGVAILEMDAVVTKMHTANGLLADCAVSDTTLAESEDFLIELVGGPETRGVVLAGASVHFDLAFLRVHMPRFARCLSHRVLDVTTLKLAERAWGEGFADATVIAHRALSDVLVSLSEARVIRARRWTR